VTQQLTYQYEIGGSLAGDAPTYVVRQADEDLYESLRAGKFCYVLNSRQMGKSSLRVRTMQRLKESGVACAEVDLTGIGSQGLTEEQWYGGVVNELIRGLQLPDSFDWRSWWRERAPLAHVQRWGRFIEEVLLTHVEQNIVIFIDEIDSVLSLQFPFDDFFAQIRFCHNKRADNPAYQRLTFCLLGVATPSDLIQDRRRTPFNIGRAIELTGFQSEEAKPLAQGLASRTRNPKAVLEAILAWTGGQPFLTQKVCQMVLDNPTQIPNGEEKTWVEQFVQTKIIENWEAQDEPEHLRTIRNRILRSEQNASHVLKLYQLILEQGQTPADNSPEQAELRLSGLVVKQNGMLEAYNPIYRAVFNQQWVEDVITKLQPQDEAVAERLGAIRNTILQHKNSAKLLALYQRILQQQNVVSDDSPETKLLLHLGLIKNHEGLLQVANRVYVNFFNQDWVEQELDKAKQRRIIRQRYEVMEKLNSGNSIPTFLVKDLQHPSKIQCILKQITPPNEVGSFARAHHLFTNAYLELQQLNTHPQQQIANLIACFDEEEKFYIVQEYVEGHNLDYEIVADQTWAEAKVIDLLIDILEILEFVHALKLSHLNLKPANIRRREKDSKLVLIDFGTLKRISALAAESEQTLQPRLLGTPGYVPPEPSGDWSEANLDIYAAGMIGIQALTGIEPKELAVDSRSGEVIWRFSTPERPEAQVSPELVQILNQMISHRSDLRYADVAPVLRELQTVRDLRAGVVLKPRRAKVAHQGLLAGCVVSLLLTNFAGYAWYQNRITAQRQQQLLDQCQQPLQMNAVGNRSVNADLIAVAENVQAACRDVQAEGINANPLEILKNRGTALLLLGKSSQSLNQANDAQQYLTDAKQTFEQALQINAADPQAHFYLGFTKQLMKDLSFQNDLRAAADAYLKLQPEQLQAIDYPILAKLARFLGKQPGQPGYDPQDFAKANQLYEQAKQDQNLPKAKLANLYYNQAVLNRKANFLKAAKILAEAKEIDSKNAYIESYSNACLKGSNAAACDSPNAQIPTVLPVYDCRTYPVLAVARLGSGNPDNLCE
jgi:tetratricopeptide (TPR) repeat protein